MADYTAVTYYNNSKISYQGTPLPKMSQTNCLTFNGTPINRAWFRGGNGGGYQSAFQIWERRTGTVWDYKSDYDWDFPAQFSSPMVVARYRYQGNYTNAMGWKYGEDMNGRSKYVNLLEGLYITRFRFVHFTLSRHYTETSYDYQLYDNSQLPETMHLYVIKRSSWNSPCALVFTKSDVTTALTNALRNYIDTNGVPDDADDLGNLVYGVCREVIPTPKGGRLAARYKTDVWRVVGSDTDYTNTETQTSEGSYGGYTSYDDNAPMSDESSFIYGIETADGSASGASFDRYSGCFYGDPKSWSFYMGMSNQTIPDVNDEFFDDSNFNTVIAASACWNAYASTATVTVRAVWNERFDQMSITDVQNDAQGAWWHIWG